MCLPYSDDFQQTYSDDVLSFWPVEKSSPSVNNLFRAIPLSHEDKIHEHTQKSLLLGRRTNLLALFAHFCRFSKGLSAENLLFGREGMTD